MAPLAKKYKEQIIFGTVDVEVFDSIPDDLHVADEPDSTTATTTWPAFAIKDVIKGHRFPLLRDHQRQQQQLSEQVLSSFVKDFVDGKLKPVRKSKPVPDDETQQLQGPVTVVVGDTYDDLVINNDKDVLVDYYTQSCGPCKAMAPTYEKLAKLYAEKSVNSSSADRVTIAKIDADANDVPGDIRGFPMFKLFPAGKKGEPVLYDGPWTVVGYANFVRDEGGHGVDVFATES